MQIFFLKNLNPKKIWISKCYKMDIKSPYHIHFLINFSFFSLNMHVKELSSLAFIHIIFIISLTIINPSIE
jgi:hypothetical protein